MGHSANLLREHILGMSKATVYSEAVHEWRWLYSYIEESECPCTIRIKENCVMVNRFTGQQTVVGNVCVHRFMGQDHSDKFRALRDLAVRPERLPSLSVVDMAYAIGVINDREVDFLRNICGKPKRYSLSDRQASWMKSLNIKMASSPKLIAPKELNLLRERAEQKR
jgi:hypothetical protein